jgi:hypothetical protein
VGGGQANATYPVKTITGKHLPSFV